MVAMSFNFTSAGVLQALPHCALLPHHPLLPSISRSIHIRQGFAFGPSYENTVLLQEEEEEDEENKRVSPHALYTYSSVAQVDYSWEEQWYPLYLTRELPHDAPLGLSVFHKQLVLHYDGYGAIHCYEDRCPHRLAKLSEGQIVDGRLECLYHGWQFKGDGQCVKIPQLPAEAKIPKAACVRSYQVHDSQGVIWVWMGDKNKADSKHIPQFKQFDDPNNSEISAVHVLPYDHSILLENLMDPAHIPISHDRTDPSAKRENAQALKFKIFERTARGFAGRWGEVSKDDFTFNSRFEAPCSFWNERERLDMHGNINKFTAIFLCRPAGQGQSMLIARFAQVSKKNMLSFIPEWIIHQVSNKVFEQDMAFLASQNEVLIREGVATSHLYLNLQSSDVFVMEYRKWLDKVGHGMPYYFGHKSLSLPGKEAVLEAAPAGLMAAAASTQPMKGAFGSLFAADPTNRYFRHVIHCSKCRQAFRNLQSAQKGTTVLSVLSLLLGVVLSRMPWRVALLVTAFLAAAGSYSCQLGINMLTTNELRPHRR